jgi:hypothetical protein
VLNPATGGLVLELLPGIGRPQTSSTEASFSCGAYRQPFVLPDQSPKPEAPLLQERPAADKLGQGAISYLLNHEKTAKK